MTIPTIAGIDPSLTACGVAVLTHPDWADTPNRPKLRTIGEKGQRHTPVRTQAKRIVRQTRRILEAIPASCELVVLEGPAYSAHNSWGSHETSGLWWGIAAGIAAKGIDLAICPPTTRAKFATGKGNADKRQVRDAIAEHWSTARIFDHNQADALALATAGAMFRGWYEAETTVQAEALGAITWPEAKLESWTPTPQKSGQVKKIRGPIFSAGVPQK